MKWNKQKWSNFKKLSLSSQRHRNCIRVHKTETPAHRNKKIELCLKLIDECRDFVTEARTMDRTRRFDIHLLDSGDVWEIETNKEVCKSDADYVYYVGEK